MTPEERVKENLRALAKAQRQYQDAWAYFRGPRTREEMSNVYTELTAANEAREGAILRLLLAANVWFTANGDTQ